MKIASDTHETVPDSISLLLLFIVYELMIFFCLFVWILRIVERQFINDIEAAVSIHWFWCGRAINDDDASQYTHLCVHTFVSFCSRIWPLFIGIQHQAKDRLTASKCALLHSSPVPSQQRTNIFVIAYEQSTPYPRPHSTCCSVMGCIVLQIRMA